ncbi:hypothetical protein Bra3105_17895 [Brachybacterium halotolerans subsp. kimchii]|uniref:hypothetical protein n=1 Tax=Brachybacterium TaxID=43668 RepID=UPI00126631CC|nr:MULTISPECIES: hypothetical protein [Brachybacterium]UEJ82675.1 hypothetical protein Bra3105_17895 [Brachybacterium halotolerans subsp. kimchii]
MNLASRDHLSAKVVRKECKPPVAAIVIALMGEGWTVVRAGHKFRLLCPCEHDQRSIKVNGTPRVPDVHAQQVERSARHCPLKHDLIQ